MALLTVPAALLDETFELLRECGQDHQECVAYWTGEIDLSATADLVEHPEHTAGRYGYSVDTNWVTRFFLDLRRKRRTTRMQIHTHPGMANHSSVDDTFSLAPSSGFLSLVIPGFARGTVGLDGAFLVEMSADGTWIERDARDIQLT